MTKHSLIPQIERVMARVEMLEQKQREMRETYVSNLAALTGWYESAIQRILSETESPSRVREMLDSIEKQLRVIRAENANPRKRPKRKSAGQVENHQPQIASEPTEDVGLSLEPEMIEAVPMISQRGICDCPVCQDRHGQPITNGQAPPYHEGCDCVAVPKGEERASKETQEDVQAHTGMMIAFMLDAETSGQLALPDGEPASNLHVTLAFLGDGGDTTLPRNPAQDSDDLTDLQHILKSVAAQEQPLQGSISGLGRFAASADSGETDPVIALVDMPRLAELRVRIASMLQMNGYFVATNHGYTPHVTLAYIEPDAPLPVETVPMLPLQFKEVCLAIGDTRYFFPMGGDSTVEGAQQNPEAVPPDAGGSEHEAAGIPEGVAGEAASDPAGDSQDGGESSAEHIAELARWRERALEDVETRAWRGFTTVIIPESMHMDISHALQGCETRGDVVRIFERHGLLPFVLPLSETASEEHIEEHAYPHDKIVLQQFASKQRRERSHQGKPSLCSRGWSRSARSWNG